MNDEPLDMTAKDLATYLQLHELTVRRLARDEELPVTRIGRQWRIPNTANSQTLRV